MDIVICDTAGRLHTAYALMEELQACKQAIAKEVGGQPSETLLVLDGTTGTLTLGCWCGVGGALWAAQRNAAGAGRENRYTQPEVLSWARGSWVAQSNAVCARQHDKCVLKGETLEGRHASKAPTAIKLVATSWGYILATLGLHPRHIVMPL